MFLRLFSRDLVVKYWSNPAAEGKKEIDLVELLGP